APTLRLCFPDRTEMGAGKGVALDVIAEVVKRVGGKEESSRLQKLDKLYTISRNIEASCSSTSQDLIAESKMILSIGCYKGATHSALGE
ncbi:MAG: hypothetical protein PVJ07_06770, partial [Anaerolineales bacterium]